MKKDFCYLPTPLDKEVAQRDITLADIVDEDEDGVKYPSPSSNGFYVSTLRGLYDEDPNNERVDWSTISPEDAIKKLGEFRKTLHKKQADKIRSNSSNMSQSFYKLRQSIDPSVRADRVNMIANAFSQIVTKYLEANPGYTRNAICNGIRVADGSIALGETAIFDEVFKELCINMQAHESLGNTHIADELCKVLDNWESLVTLARIKLRDTEGLILGGQASYSSQANSENYEDNMIADMFDMHEATREGWQEIAESMSAYASIGTDVRRVISMLPMLDNSGQPVLDDLGMPKFMDPVRVHQALLKMVRGSVNSYHMLSLLERSKESGQGWLAPVIDALTPVVVDLDGNEIKCRKASDYMAQKAVLRSQMAEEGYTDEEIEREMSRVDSENSEKWQNLTKFNNDLGKTFTFLSVLKEQVENGILKFKTKVLNRVSSLDSRGQALSNMRLGNVTSTTLSLFDKEGNVDWEGATALEDVLTKGFKGTFAEITHGTRAEKAALLIKVANALGFNLSQYAASSIISNGNQRQDFIDAANQLLEYGLKGRSFASLKGTKLSMKNAMTFKSEHNPSDVGVIEEVVGKLADIIAANDENLQYESRVSYVDKRGNKTTLSSDVNPSFLSDKFDMIKSIVNAPVRTEGGREIIPDRQQLLKSYLEKNFFTCPIYAEKKADGTWNIHNVWLRELYNSPAVKDGSGTRFTPDSFAAQFDYKRFLGDDKADGAQRFEDYTEKRHAISMLMEFMGPRETNWKTLGARYANYPVFIQGDSGVSKFIRAKVYSEQEVLDSMYEAYEQELIRMRLAHEANIFLEGLNCETIDNFGSKETTFTTLPFLNKVFDAEWVDNNLKVYKKGTKTEVDPIDVKNAIEKEMDDSYTNFAKKLLNQGLYEKSEDGRYMYLSNFAEPKHGEIKLTDKHKNQLHAQLRSYFFNTRLNTISQIQMMTVDTGFYKGVEDLQKRYKEIHAPGVKIDPTAYDVWNNCPVSDGIERVIYFDDISINAEETNKEFMDVIKKVFKNRPEVIAAYQNNTLTDGQGYRTLDSYRKVMIMAGKWGAKEQEAYSAIKDIQKKGDLTEEDTAKLQELAVVFQPIKPYLYTMENLPCGANGAILKVPVQHKYAEVVLIPELLPKGSKLRALAVAMQNNNIDVAGSTKIVKVGGFGASAFDYKTNEQGLFIDKDGNVIPHKGKKLTRSSQRKYLDELRKAGKELPVVPTDETDITSIIESAVHNTGGVQDKTGYVHQLSYSDYRIQTNVPEHINHAALFGTQVRKLIMTGLDQGSTHYENYVTDSNGNPVEVNLGPWNKSAKLNGKRLLWFYNQLITANILESLNGFISAISSDESVSRQLIQNIISNSRECQDNILAYSLTQDEKFLVPLFEGGMSHDSSAALLSVFKKMVNKQQIAGGAAVQASAWGITRVEEGKPDDGTLQYHVSDDGSNILWADCEIPFNFKYTDRDGNEVQLDYNKYCTPEGEFKLSGRKINKGGKLIDETLIEQHFPGILDIVAYRIPTESHYSMMNLRVKRCSPPTAGGTIKVPSQGTTQAGFDFDIDKLYLMRKEFKAEKFTKEEISEIWKDFYRSNPAIKHALEKARAEGIAAQDFITQIFEGFKGDDAKAIAETSETGKGLTKYWKEAGLEGTPKEAFARFVEENGDKYRRLVEYDPSKPVSTLTDNSGATIAGNSRVARNNMLLNLIQQRLMDPETLKTRYTPGGFEAAKSAAKTMRGLAFSDEIAAMAEDGYIDMQAVIDKSESMKDPKPEYDYSDPTTMLVYNQQNQVAGKLIGIFANQNVNHAFASLMERYDVNTPISFGFHIADGGLSDLIHNPLASQTTAEFLASSVDAVKDPVLNFLNLNVITADAGAVLARLGYSSIEIGLLFQQPAIKYICDVSLNEGISTDEAIKKAQEKFPIDKDINVSDTEMVLGANRLAWNIIASREGKEHPDVKDKDGNMGKEFQSYQGKVIELFTEILSVSKEVGEFVNSTRWTASNSVKSRMGDMYAQQLKVKRYIEEQSTKEETKTSMIVAPGFKTILADGKAYEDLQKKSVVIGNGGLNMSDFEYMMAISDNPFAYEQAMFDANRKAMRELCGKYFPYETTLYSKVRELLETVSTYGIDGDIIEDAHRDIMTYALSKMPGSRFSETSILRRGANFGEQTDRVSSGHYFREVFAKKMFDFIKSNPSIVEANPLLSAMTFESQEGPSDYAGNTETTVKLNIKSVSMQAQQQDVLKESWEAMLLSDNPALVGIAEDLFFYNFFNSGFSYGPTAFTDLAPSMLRANLVIGTKDGNPLLYRDMLQLLQEGKLFTATMEPTVLDFVRQFIKNNHNNRRLVYNFTDKSVGIEMAKKKASSRSFTVSPNETKYPSQNPFLIGSKVNPKTGETQYMYRAAVKIGGVLYMCDSGSTNFNTVTGEAPITYTRVETNDNGTYNSSVIQSEEARTDALGTSEELRGSVVGEFNGPVYVPNTVSAEEQEIINNMSPELRAAYENSSEDKKREVLEGIKGRKCYQVIDGVIREAIC